MDTVSETDDKTDSVIRLREYVRDYKLKRGEVFVDVGKATKVTVTDKAESSNSNSIPDSLSPGSKSKSCTKTNMNLTIAAKDFMDTSSISSSSTASNIRDYEDDYISYSDRRRPSFFIESSRVSMSSDDDEEDPPTRHQHLMKFILADRPLGPDDEIYNDWDSGLSHSSIELNREDDDNGDNRSWVHASNFFPPPDSLEAKLDFPHRALRVMECQICLEKEYLRRRVCCDFQICNNCITLYLTGKVTDGKVQIECANDRCNALMFKEEIRHRLPLDVREKFVRFLIDANKDPHVKTCPSCSLPYEIDPARLKISKKKRKFGVEVTCSQCHLVWCFHCQAPFHTNMTCKRYRNEDEMVKRWAKEKSYGQVNAQRCPKCKIFVQKMDGCDHMKCTQCETDFCYRCGDRYISVKFFGSHWNRFSLFGCKYRLMPEKNGLRRLIRGSHFFGRVLAAVVIAGLGVAAGAVLVAGSVVILPGYGIFVLRRRMWAAKQRKKFDRVKMRMISMAEQQQAMMLEKIGNLDTVMEESEPEAIYEMPPQEVQVIVHHPEEAVPAMENTNKDCDIIVNKYVNANEDADLALPQLQTTSLESDVAATADDVRDFRDISSHGKHKKLVGKFMTSMKQEEEEQMEDNVDSGIIFDEEGGDDGCRLEKEDSSVREIECEIVGLSRKEKETGDVPVMDQRKMSQSESKAPGEQSENNIGEILIVDAQNNLSLSKGEDNLNEKSSAKKVLKADNGNKTDIPLKADGENEGKGCFGNIFNVGKRAVVNSVSHEEGGGVKSNKENLLSLDTRKVATWEKRRRDRAEIDLSEANKPLTIDPNNDGTTNNLPLIICRSSSSISSVKGNSLTNGDKVYKKKDTGSSLSDDNLLRREKSCERDSNTVRLPNNEHSCVDSECCGKIGSSINLVGVEHAAESEECLNKIHFEIADVDSKYERHSDHISPISLVTHL